MKNQDFPPITTIATDAWHVVSTKLLQLVGLAFGSSFLSILVLGLGTIITFMVSAVTIDVSQLEQSASNPQIGLDFLQKLLEKWPIFALGFGITFVLAMVIGLITQIALIRLLGDKKPQSMSTVIAQAFPLLLPLLITQLVVALLGTGGMFVFFIPGVIISLLLSFAQYELILQGQGIVSAIKNSVKIVSSHLGAIVLYMLGFGFVYIMIFYFVPNVIAKLDESSGAMVMLLRFVASLFVGWFGAAFNIQMFFQARKLTDLKKHSSLVWIVLTALIGYLIFGLMVFGIVKAVKSEGLIEKAMQSFEEETAQPITRVPSSCGISIPHPETTTGEGDETRKWYYEEHSLTSQSFVVLDEDVHPRKFTLGAYMRYATEPFAPDAKNFPTDVATVLIKCTQNLNKLTLDEFAALAAANKERDITIRNKGFFGEIETILVDVGIPDTDEKESGFLAVSEDGNRLMYITSWTSVPGDEHAELLRTDTDFIVSNLQYRDVPVNLIEVQQKASQTTPAKPATGADSSCKKLTISQGEFASDKCYSITDYNELANYIRQFDSNASGYNAAAAQANVTCSGFTDSFKQKCEQSKVDMQKYQDAMSGFRVAINAVIARGK